MSIFHVHFRKILYINTFSCIFPHLLIAKITNMGKWHVCFVLQKKLKTKQPLIILLEDLSLDQVNPVCVHCKSLEMSICMWTLVVLSCVFLPPKTHGISSNVKIYFGSSSAKGLILRHTSVILENKYSKTRGVMPLLSLGRWSVPSSSPSIVNVFPLPVWLSKVKKMTKTSRIRSLKYLKIPWY